MHTHTHTYINNDFIITCLYLVVVSMRCSLQHDHENHLVDLPSIQIAVLLRVVQDSGIL